MTGKCMNGACVVDRSSKKFLCKCDRGYYGQDCRFSAMIDVVEGRSRNFDDEEELISVIEIAPATTEKPQKLGSDRGVIPRALTFNGVSKKYFYLIITGVYFFNSKIINFFFCLL